MGRPRKIKSVSELELQKAEKTFESFSDQVKELSSPPLSESTLEKRKEDADFQTKLSKQEIKHDKTPYLKPERYISSSPKEKFNPLWEKLRERDREYVKVIVENNEVKGESVALWYKKWPTDNAEFWQVPVNKPVYIPRGVADQLAKCRYNRLTTAERPMQQVLAEASAEGGIGISQTLVVKETHRRIDCRLAEGF